jgi:hypothetical protein
MREKNGPCPAWHVLRHGAVSAMIAAKVDPVSIASFVGDDVKTIMSTYAQQFDTAKDDNPADVLGAAIGGTS